MSRYPILPKYNHCCGCSACFSACPHDSIAMELDFEGFYYPFALRARFARDSHRALDSHAKRESLNARFT